MMILIGFIAGILNGIFASFAGQLIILYLVFIKKNDSHIMRNISLSVMAIASFITLLTYNIFLELDILTIVTIILLAIVGGYIGNKLMEKVNSKVLNLVAAIATFTLSIYGVINL